jgi:hypothetical protein
MVEGGQRLMDANQPTQQLSNSPILPACKVWQRSMLGVCVPPSLLPHAFLLLHIYRNIAAKMVANGIFDRTALATYTNPDAGNGRVYRYMCCTASVGLERLQDCLAAYQKNMVLTA